MILAIFVSKIITVGENVIKLWQNNFDCFYWDTAYTRTSQ